MPTFSRVCPCALNLRTGNWRRTNSLYFCLNNPYLPNELPPSAYHSKGQKRNCAYPGNTKWAMQQQRKKKKMILRVTRKSVKYSLTDKMPKYSLSVNQIASMNWNSTVGYGETRKKGHNSAKNQNFKKKIKKNHFLRVTSRVLCPNFKSLAQTV